MAGLGAQLGQKLAGLEEGILDSIGNAFPGLRTPSPASKHSNSLAGTYRGEISGAGLGPNEWTIDPQDWYKVFGYRFTVFQTLKKDIDEIQESSGYSETSQYHFTLPIPPQSIMIQPVIPQKVTSTLGGVVEEKSPIKFWMINMSGTTGTAISRADGDEINREKMAQKFREVISTTGLLSGLARSANSAISRFGGAVDNIADIIKNPSVGGVTGAVNDFLTPPLPYSNSAVSDVTNGFTEAQELQKFFYMYHSLSGKSPNRYMLRFTNFKTNQSWRCAITSFGLQQSASDPHLFRYNISLQGWDVKSTTAVFGDNAKNSSSYDRFGKNGDLKSVNTLLDPSATKVVENGFKSVIGIF